MYGGLGMSTPSLHRESTDSLISLILSHKVLQALSSHLPETLKGFAVSANLSPDTKV